MHRAAAPSCTPATRDRTGRLHRDVHGRPAACRNLGLLDDSGLASASRPRIARGPQAPGRQPGHPGARSPSPAASGRPGRARVHPLRRDPRSAPPPGGTVPVRQTRRTGTPAHHGNPGRPCRRQKRTVRRQHEPTGRLASIIARKQRQITTASLVSDCGGSRVSPSHSGQAARAQSCLTRAGHRPVVWPHEILDSGISHRNTGSCPCSGTEEHDISPVSAALEHAAGDLTTLGMDPSLECSSPPRTLFRIIIANLGAEANSAGNRPALPTRQ